MNRSTPLFRRWLLPVLLVLGAFALAAAVRAEEVIPTKPTRYFNDYALTVRPETADLLNKQLADYERESSNQLLVCIYPKMQTDSDIADYCQRIFRAWDVGQKGKNNGAVLFVFVQDHKTRIHTGYGLEAVLPDATCQQILGNVIRPRFKENDFDGGLTAGVAAMIAASKGEFKGDGLTQYQRTHRGESGGGGISFGMIIFLVILAFIIFSSFRRRGMGSGYSGGGPVIFGGPSFGGGGFGGSSSDSGSSSSSSSDDGGSFSSGGGDSGGGGASGDW